MGFLYYLPGMSRIPSLDELRTRGLGYAFEQPPEACAVTSGPDGGSGMIVHQPAAPAPRIGYYPDQQRWIEVPKGENGPPHLHLIGMYVDAMPTPETLEREQLLTGHLTRLGDGNRWMIPAARMLPKAYVYRSDAGWTNEPIEAHGWIWPEAERVAAAYTTAGANLQPGEPALVDVTPDDVELAAKLLMLNYRVSQHELSAMRALTTDVIPSVLLALLDWPTIKKKVLCESANSTPG